MSKITDKITSRLMFLLYHISPVIQTRYLYKRRLGRTINLDHPMLFQDKLNWLKLFVYANDPLVIQCADKYRVREYVCDCGLAHLLNDIYQSAACPEQLDFNALPDKFVIKTNFGYGDIILCNDKSQLNISMTKKILNKNIRRRFGYRTCEPHYTKIKPCIVTEKYLENNPGERLLDYKIFCFNGNPKFIRVIYDRTKTSHKTQCYDCSWTNILSYYKSADLAVHIDKPASLDQMLESARILSKPFPFVRVDFYDIAGRAVFGEMTFTPSSCLNGDFTLETEKILGDMLTLPIK